jgi:xylulokinase
MTLWLAFDIGTTGTKAALITSEGRVLQSASASYPTRTADGGIVEQQATDWWTAVCEAARVLANHQQYGQVDAVALTGQMQDVILLDSAGEPVRPVILYSDTRARAEADEINLEITTRLLRELTANTQDAGGLLAKLLWLARREPAALGSRTAHLLLGAADYIAYKMTGIAVTDSTTASTTGLMNMRTRIPLDRTLLSEIGIGACFDLMPLISAGGALAGKLTSEAARVLGLRAGLPVYHGPGDAGAATIGAGSGEAGQAYIYLGTSGWLAFSAGEPAVNEGVITLAHPDPARYIHIAPLLTAGGNLEWVRDLFGTDDYDALIVQGLRQPPAHVLYLPYLNGERSPFSDPLARAAFIGLGARTNRADLCRAVLEGVVFGFRHALDALVSAPPAMLTFTGGGTRTQGWCQLFADIINIPVAIAGDAENVGVRGAVIAAQVDAGEQPNYAPQGMFPVEIRLHPNPATRQHYDHQYGLFRQVYPALAPVFAGLGS